MPNPTSTRGGAREGAGRPATGRTPCINVTCDDATREAIERAGGGSFAEGLRRLAGTADAVHEVWATHPGLQDRVIEATRMGKVAVMTINRHARLVQTWYLPSALYHRAIEITEYSCGGKRVFLEVDRTTATWAVFECMANGTTITAPSGAAD